MFCSNCGAPLADQSVFCSACGTPTGQAQPVRIRRRPNVVLRIVVGIGLLVLLWSWLSRNPQTDSNAPHAAEPAEVTPRPPHIYQPGEDVTVGYWTYRCNGCSAPR